MEKTMKFRIFFLLLCIGVYNLFASGIREESDFPEPETIITLPDTLIGEFIIFPGLRTITIFQNNKYLISGEKNSDVILVGYDHGYIVKENDQYYLNPLINRVFFDKIEIEINDNGFSFFSRSSRFSNNYGSYNAIRKRELHANDEAQKIKISTRESINQYFLIQERPNLKIFTDTTFLLTIENGIVELQTLNTGETKFYWTPGWKGYIDIKEKNQETIIGTITADDYDFCFSNDGIVSIEITEENIKMIVYCYIIPLHIDIPEDISVINFPIIFIIEW